MRKSVKWGIVVLGACALSATALRIGQYVRDQQAEGPAYRITKAQYYDKTLAGILGQVGGVLTGYEFVSEEPLPDEWFALMEGPYSGNAAYVAQPQNDRLFEDRGGAIGSDDDYHIDFFNQLILDKYGPEASHQDIREAWLAHDVSDWGGGGAAMDNMSVNDMVPPQTGKSEFNRFYWVTESYIENDTLGMTAPGMPMTAYELTDKFASLSGEFDTVAWARFLAAMYAIAYFEDDARAAMDKASAVLPRDGWPYRMYAKVKALYEENPNDWRWAQAELRKVKRSVYGYDNIQVIPDINNALAMLAIQYGNNDYVQSARIASLSGYDADCTASFVMGLMGIIKGMAGTPNEVKETVYRDGEGVYVNDLTFTPHIGRNYPEEQKFTDIAKLYQANAERMIAARGGKIEAEAYVIRGEIAGAAKVVQIDNADFEHGDLRGWETQGPAADAGHIYAQDNGTALSGDWKGRIDIDEESAEGKLFVRLAGLREGATYRVHAYLTADSGVEGRLYVEQEDGQYAYASATNRIGYYAGRSLEFVAAGPTAEVGLHALAVDGVAGAAGAAAIDNLTVEALEKPVRQRCEAEEAKTDAGAGILAASGASGGKYAQLGSEGPGTLTFDGVHVDRSGEFLLRIHYANDWNDTTRLEIRVNGRKSGTVWFPQTGSHDSFSANVLETPVVLEQGDNRIAFGQTGELQGVTGIDFIEVSSFAKPMLEF